MTSRTGIFFTFAFLGVFVGLGYADQGGFTNSGGSASAGASVAINSTTADPAGTLNIACPSTGSTGCTSGSLSFASDDGTTQISATFTSGSATESCYGGGRGGHTTCYYTISANFSGVLTENGATQAIVGETSQSFEYSPIAGAASGTSTYNSAYSPFYYSDTEQILRSDDLQGTNQITYGSGGGGVGQFYGAYGIALDSLGRIYIADTYNCRVVRIDDMKGTNWTTYGGTCGSGPGEFYDPMGIAVDSTGKIYVMDTGNSRLISIDDMTGANWTTFGSVGSGVDQFASFLSVAVDASNRIYVADAGNLRIVRMDDMTGANWTTLSQSPPINGVSYSFASPMAVAVDSAGRIYIADDEYEPAVVRVDDMTGANWTSVFIGSSGGSALNSIAVDSGGTVFVSGDYGVRTVDDMLGVLTSGGAIGPIGTYYIFGITPVPVANPRPSAISLSPTSLSFSQNVGTQSATQTVTIANFGGSALSVSDVSATGPFGATSNCPLQLAAGSNCTVSVTFTPTITGPSNGMLTVTDDSGNAGATQTVALTGTGTAPGANVSPTSLSFSSQVVGTTSASKTVTLKSTGTGPLQITTVGTNAPFIITSNSCSGSISPSSSCTVQVAFSPTALGSASGTLTITDNAGTQTVKLSGTGIAPVALSVSSLNFGKVKVGTTSTAKTVSLTNHQSVSLNFSSSATTSSYAISSNTCGTSLKANGKCTVGVTFSPTVTGMTTGSLTFIDDASNSPQVVSLTGAGD